MGRRIRFNYAIPVFSTIFSLAAASLWAMLVWAADREAGNAAVPLYQWVLATGVIGMLLGLVARFLLCRRLQTFQHSSQAWSMGNLQPRISMPPGDEWERLAETFNLLAQQLQQDEQDLMELRQRETRLTDQVRALSILEERNRLARELHDSVKQHLFSLSMMASAAHDFDKTRPGALPADLVEILLQMKVTAQTTQQALSHLIADLHPTSLAEQGLGAALNETTLILGAREHLLIYLNVQGNDALIPLAAAETLYLVAQEALANVVRHARATRVDVGLWIVPEQVILRVCDDGVGFDTSQPRRGMGTPNMQDRLVAVNGRLRIESQAGRGTTVTAEVPLVHQSHPSVHSCTDKRPMPAIVGNWPWLGQKLVIPVGQTWPWLPADERDLLQPLVEAGVSPVSLRSRVGVLGFGKAIILQPTSKNGTLPAITPLRSGYQWRYGGATWVFRSMASNDCQWVLYRNEQPLAAMQRQGRQMDMWNEIVYAGHGYRISRGAGHPVVFVLSDANQQDLIQASFQTHVQFHLKRDISLPLFLIAALRIQQEIHSLPKNGTIEPIN